MTQKRWSGEWKKGEINCMNGIEEQIMKAYLFIKAFWETWKESDLTILQ